jgi:hypothetical protein
MIREVETGTTVIDQFPAFEDDGFTKRSGLTAGNFTPTVFRDGAVLALSVTISEIGTTGEYKVEFTPSVDGYYDVQVLIGFSKEIWFGTYQSVAELTHDLSEDSRDRTKRIDEEAITLPPADDSLVDHLTNKGAAKTYNSATDSLEALSDALSSGNATINASIAQMQADIARVLGLLHRNGILDNQTYDGQGQLTSARLRVFDSPANVPTTPGGTETAGLLQEYTIESEWAGLNVATKFVLKQVL